MRGTEKATYRLAGLDEIIDLRNRIIILGTARESPYFEGDHDPGTLHFGAFLESDCIGCLTFLPREWEGKPAWQLRGMATERDFQRKGIGKALLQFSEETLKRNEKANLLWCNARAPAVGFYLKRGWTAVSEEFDIDGVGPHVKMTKSL